MNERPTREFYLQPKLPPFDRTFRHIPKSERIVPNPKSESSTSVICGDCGEPMPRDNQRSARCPHCRDKY